MSSQPDYLLLAQADTLFLGEARKFRGQTYDNDGQKLHMSGAPMSLQRVVPLQPPGRIYLTRTALATIEAEARRHGSAGSSGHETGGILVGRRLGAYDSSGSILIAAATGPGRNAFTSPTVFEPDLEYVSEQLDQWRSRFPRTDYIGTWHKHPPGYATFSPGDVRTAHEVFADPSYQMDEIVSPIVLVASDGAVEIHYFYMSRRMAQKGESFFPIDRAIVQLIEDDDLLVMRERLDWDVTYAAAAPTIVLDQRDLEGDLARVSEAVDLKKVFRWRGFSSERSVFAFPSVLWLLGLIVLCFPALFYLDLPTALRQSFNLPLGWSSAVLNSDSVSRSAVILSVSATATAVSALLDEADLWRRVDAARDDPELQIGLIAILQRNNVTRDLNDRPLYLRLHEARLALSRQLISEGRYEQAIGVAREALQASQIRTKSAAQPADSSLQEAADQLAKAYLAQGQDALQRGQLEVAETAFLMLKGLQPEPGPGLQPEIAELNTAISARLGGLARQATSTAAAVAALPRRTPGGAASAATPAPTSTPTAQPAAGVAPSPAATVPAIVAETPAPVAATATAGGSGPLPIAPSAEPAGATATPAATETPAPTQTPAPAASATPTATPIAAQYDVAFTTMTEAEMQRLQDGTICEGCNGFLFTPSEIGVAIISPAGIAEYKAQRPVMKLPIGMIEVRLFSLTGAVSPVFATRSYQVQEGTFYSLTVRSLKD